MAKATPVPAGVLIGLLLGWGAAQILDPDPQPAPARVAAPDPIDPANGAPTGDAPDTPSPAVHDQLARIDGRLAALETAIAELPSRLPARVPVDAPQGAEIDGEALLTALDRATEQRARRKLEGMSNEALLSEARRLLNGEKDAAAAKKALAQLLERSLTPAERAGALTELGIVERQSGDLAASQRTLQQTVDAYGTSSKEGAWAAFQLLWTVRRQGDANRALTLADAVANSTEANESLQLHGRWIGAQLAQELGDLTRARADFASILRDFADQPGYENILADVKRRLAGL